MPPIRKGDGTTVIPDGVSQVRTGDGRILFDGPAIPDSEGFEHNDLSGNYAGDTGQFNIQTGTVDQGTYALEGGNPESHSIITRSTATSAFGRYGVRIDWRQYLGVDANGGVAIMTSQQGLSSNSGYSFNSRSDVGAGVGINKYDSGSVSSIASNTSSTPSTGQWIDCFVELPANGDLDFTADGVSTSVTDTSHTDIYLAFHTFRGPHFIDDVQFSSL